MNSFSWDKNVSRLMNSFSWDKTNKQPIDCDKKCKQVNELF